MDTQRPIRLNRKKDNLGLKVLLVILLQFVLAFLVSCGPEQSQAQQPPADRIAALRKQIQNPQDKQVMVVAHRGDWRHAPENSLQAIENCIAMGVDMVEIDVRMSKDGVPVIIHDETLDRTTTGSGMVGDHTLNELKELFLRNGAGHPTHHRIPTLEEAMLTARGKILINLDKCYDYFDIAYQVLKETGTVDHVVLKARKPLSVVKEGIGQYLDEVLFMPIVSLDNARAWMIIEEYQQEIQPVAFELIFKSTDSPSFTSLARS